MKKTILTTSSIAILASLTFAGQFDNTNYYGSTRDGSNVDGNIINDLSEGDLNYYYGGTVNTVKPGQACGSVNGNIYNNLYGVTIKNYVGANWANDSSGNPSVMGGVSGTIFNNISNSTVKGKFYAGNLSSGPNAKWTVETIGSIETNITNNSYVQEVCVSGGAIVNRVIGNASVNIVDSTVAEIFHNGGTYIGGDCNIKLTNSNVVGNYFYGSGSTNLSSSYDWANPRGINGNLNIILEGSTKVNNDIFATDGDVNGSVNITITDTAIVGGTIYGGNGNAKEKVLNIGGEKSFNGSALKADSFDSVNISSDSIVDISLANISKLSIENGAKVSLASESEFEKLLIRFDDEIFELGGTVDISEIFGDSASVVLSEIESGSSFTILDANQNLFTVGLAGGTLSITSEIPEPSTYAAIIGAIALAFAAYRRRK